MKEPTIEELIETVKERKSQLASCCGQCHHCRASKKIIKAYERYEESRLSEWPEEFRECEKCGSREKVGTMAFGKDADAPQIDLCEECHSDTEGWSHWLAEEMMKAVAADPDYELQPDGKTYGRRGGCTSSVLKSKRLDRTG